MNTVCWHDQDRFGIDCRGRRRILDQFDEAVAVDDLASGYGHLLAGSEVLGADRRLAADRTLPVRPEIHRTADKISATLAQGRDEHLGIGCNEIHW
jgi:hypothetical protein